MTVRFVTTMFFANALVAMCLIWAMNTWNPAFLWYPIVAGSTYAWACYFLGLRAAEWRGFQKGKRQRFSAQMDKAEQTLDLIISTATQQGSS